VSVLLTLYSIVVGQLEQEALPAAENWPTAQALHTVFSVVVHAAEVNEPAPQTAQAAQGGRPVVLHETPAAQGGRTQVLLALLQE
jgi:hypothetical protein